MNLTFNLKAQIPATPEQIYNTWLDSNLHAKMTESNSAVASHEIGANHQAHDGYIWGKNVELIPHEKIVQTWRTSSFKDHEEDSVIEVNLRATNNGTEVTLIHKNLPETEFHVEQGWFDHYFEPMKRFFSK